MGKGDKRSKRGKIIAGTNGKSRPKKKTGCKTIKGLVPKAVLAPKAAPKAEPKAAAKPAAKPAAKKPAK